MLPKEKQKYSSRSTSRSPIGPPANWSASITTRWFGPWPPGERIEQLRRLTKARGIEPSTLVRQWVIELLDDSEDALGGRECGLPNGSATSVALPPTCATCSTNAPRRQQTRSGQPSTCATGATPDPDGPRIPQRVLV